MPCPKPQNQSLFRFLLSKQREHLVQAVRPRSLNTIVMARLPSREVSSLARIILLGEKRAVSTEWSTILLQHVSIEEVAVVRAVSTTGAGSVFDVLRLSVRCAQLWVEWSREEVVADAGVWVGVGARAVGCVAPA